MGYKITNIHTSPERCKSKITVINHGVWTCQRIKGHTGEHGDPWPTQTWPNHLDEELLDMDPRSVALIEELAQRPTKVPPRDAMCKCDHSIGTHDIVKRHNGCDSIGCPCLQFSLRSSQETP